MPLHPPLLGRRPIGWRSRRRRAALARRRPRRTVPAPLTAAQASALGSLAAARWSPPTRALPATRADCAAVPRPCPYVQCRYHLWVGTGCVLDVVDASPDGVKLDPIAEALGIDLEPTRQIERAARSKLLRTLDRPE